MEKKKKRLQRGTEWPALVRRLAGRWTDLPSAERLRKSRAKRMTRRARDG
jgi:hypothetical protein